MRTLTCLFMLAAIAAAQPDQIHLAWVEDASTTLTVVWHTAEAAVPPVVRYRPAGSQKWLEAKGGPRISGTAGGLHEATLRGLKPATKYEYRVSGANGSWSDVYAARTGPAARDASFDFVFVADTGMIGRTDGLTTGTRQVIDEVAKLDPLFVLWGGDAAYYNTDKRFGTLDQTIDAWFNQMKPVAVKAPLMPTYGNHEIFLKEGYLFWADRWPTPEGYDNRRFYSFDVGGIHFVSILAADSERGAIPASAMRWIENDMAKARKAGARWIIPFLHVAPFSDGSNHPSNEDIRAQLGPLFEKMDVKIALTCHDQSYERTWPLRGVPGNIAATSQAKDCYGRQDGVTWVKVGPGGKMSNINGKFAQFKTNPAPFWTAVRDNTTHHFARLRASGEAIKVEIFGVKGNGDAPVVQDAFQYNLKGCESAAAPVGQWDRFETVVHNARKYADPYKDVTLNVTYTRPDKSKAVFWGFYDGGDTWRLRFMPDRTGTWRWEASFSDGTPGAKGSFECVASKLPGMISVEERNPMWFGYAGGGHAILRAFHAGDRFFAANWPAEKRKAFLDWAGRQGYNTLSIASHYLNRNAPGRGQGWETPKLWPLDAAEYGRMEAALDDLARRRMIVWPFAGFFGQQSNYPRDPAEQERYIRYTLARLAPYWNLMFSVAGPEPNVGKKWMSDEDVERLGRLIRKLDPSGHLLAVHNRTGDDPYRDAEWSTYGVLQGPKTIDRDVLSRGLLRNHHVSKPLLAQETLWSGNKFHVQRHGGYSADDVRKNAWVIQMSAAALVFADNNGDSSSGFTGSLEIGEQRQEHHDIVRRVWDFMESVPYYRMRPRQDLVDRGYCLAEPGERYLVYLPDGGAVNAKVEGGAYRAVWINGRNPAERRAAGETRDGRGLAAPDTHDWVLSLER